MNLYRITPLELRHLIDTLDAVGDELLVVKEDYAHEVSSNVDDLLHHAYTILESLKERKEELNEISRGDSGREPENH